MDWLITNAYGDGISLLTKRGTWITHLKKSEFMKLLSRKDIKRYKTEQAANRKVEWLENIYGGDKYRYIREDQIEYA